jgi:hypothetical protein
MKPHPYDKTAPNPAKGTKLQQFARARNWERRKLMKWQRTWLNLNVYSSEEKIKIQKALNLIKSVFDEDNWKENYKALKLLNGGMEKYERYQFNKHDSSEELPKTDSSLF